MSRQLRQTTVEMRLGLSLPLEGELCIGMRSVVMSCLLGECFPGELLFACVAGCMEWLPAPKNWQCTHTPCAQCAVGRPARKQGIDVNRDTDATHCGLQQRLGIRPGRLNHGRGNGKKRYCNQAIMVLHLGKSNVMTSMVLAPASTERTLAISVFRVTAAVFLCVSPLLRRCLCDP